MPDPTRGAAEREAIAESMASAKGRETIDINAAVAELSVIKQLKATNLEHPDDDLVAAELEGKSEAMKAKLEALVQEDLGAAQDLVAQGYKSAAFDHVDLIEMGFDRSTVDRLIEKLS